MPSTTTYQAGDVILIAFPYTESAKAKRRPALVLLDAGDADIVVARVTTHIYQTPYDVLIRDWQAAGLLAPSVVRLHKLATLEKALIDRKLGALSPSDHQEVAAVLKRIFRAW